MAKRKRLSPAALTDAPTPAPAPASDGPLRARPPIAQVAGDAAATSALEELASEMKTARTQGRLVQDIALADIKADHLVRDRISSDAEDMAALRASLADRGQQTPIEVVALADGGYGLVSGYRRLQALQGLFEDTQEARFDQIQALIKPLEGASDSYVAMVEENEIRADLSFYERARLAAEAARIGVYPTPARAVSVLFAHAPAPKRSKIVSFLRVHDRLGRALRFPAAIPEKLGLALSKTLEADKTFEGRIKDNLRKAVIETPQHERAVLDRSLKANATRTAPAPASPPDITLDVQRGRVVLAGAGVTPALVRDLEQWLSRR